MISANFKIINKYDSQQIEKGNFISLWFVLYGFERIHNNFRMSGVTVLHHLPKQMLVFLVLVVLSQCLYTPYYKRCRLNHTKTDVDAILIADLKIERVPEYYTSYYIEPITHTQEFNYFYHKFIGAGGSGEVYLVEDQKTMQGRVLKRYFKQMPLAFRFENYIMKKLNYQIKWSKDCEMEVCSPNSTKFHTVALFPHKDSIVMRSLQFDGQELPLIFYKVLKEMDKIHRAGVIHHDIKLGNIMVNARSPDFKFYEVQLIDWNIAVMFFKGFDGNGKSGTKCYYSPEQLMGAAHVTPAMDIFSLGVMIYAYLADSKPYIANCSQDNLQAVGSLVGERRLLEVFEKYNYHCNDCMELFAKLEGKIDMYKPRSFQSFQPKVNAQYFTLELYEVLMRMFQPDPELRGTPEQLLKMKFFQNVKRLPPMYQHKNKDKDDEKARVEEEKRLIQEQLEFQEKRIAKEQADWDKEHGEFIQKEENEVKGSKTAVQEKEPTKKQGL